MTPKIPNKNNKTKAEILNPRTAQTKPMVAMLLSSERRRFLAKRASMMAIIPHTIPAMQPIGVNHPNKETMPRIREIMACVFAEEYSGVLPVFLV